MGIWGGCAKDHRRPSITIPDVPVIAEIETTGVPKGVDSFDGINISVNGQDLPLYSVMMNNTHIWSPYPLSRTPSPVGYFYKSEGIVEVVIELPYALEQSTIIRPLDKMVESVMDTEHNTIKLTITQAGSYVVEPNSRVQNAIFLFVKMLKDPENKDTSAKKTIVFEAGLHSRLTNPLIDNNDNVYLDSNTIVIMEKGSVVRAKFVANGKSSITIMGPGIIDGSQFERNASTGEVSVPVAFYNCTDIVLKDFAVHDTAGWTINFFFTHNSLIEGLKIFTSRSNGDGISLQSCKNIEVRGCFLRTWDDALVVKNYPSQHMGAADGVTDTILFEDCILWIDLAQAMEIGYETTGEILKNVTFKNINVLHAFHKPVISIHNANNAYITQIFFENITVENAWTGMGDAGWNYQLIDIRNTFSENWSTNHTITGLGTIDGVIIKNVYVLDGRDDLPILIDGTTDKRYGTDHYVKNVTMENINIKGTRLTQEYQGLRIGSLTQAITLK